MLLWRFLQIRSLFWNDRPFHRADLYTNATVYARGKVYPVPVSTFDIFAWAGMNASHRTGIDAIGNAFADIRNNCMRHTLFSSDFFAQLVKTFFSSVAAMSQLLEFVSVLHLNAVNIPLIYII